MKSNLHEELRMRRYARREDTVFLGIGIVLGIIAIIGFGFCIAYNIPIYG